MDSSSINKAEVKSLRIKGRLLIATKLISEFDYKVDKDFGERQIRKCANPNCTSEGFDLFSAMRNSVVEKRIIKGSMGCTGKLSAKYKMNSAQTCDGYIEYEIIPCF